MRARNISCGGISFRNEGPEFSHSVEKDADVAAEADHAKTFADPVGGGLGRGRQEAGGDSMAVASGDQVVHGLQQAGMIELGGDAHGDGQIVVADPCDVDAGNRNDGFEILECANSFELNNDENVFVDLGKEFGAARAIDVVRAAGGAAALSEQGVLESADEL